MREYLLMKQIRNTLFFVLFLSIITTGLEAARRSGNGKVLPGIRYKADSGRFDGNRISDDLENNGMLVSHRITGHSGMEWPKGSHKYINYASGLWVAGKVGGEIRTAVAEYGPEFVAGPWGSDQGAAEHQLYIVNKSDLADPLSSDDFQNWPTDLGAPYVDVDGNGSYNPLPSGSDHPEFLGDQVIWWVMNDGVQSQHSINNTLPLGIEIQMTIWGYDRPDGFGDMMFVKGLLINKGGVDVDSTIIGLWADPDLGDAGDDFVGCDTTLSLGYCYNDGADSDYGVDAPAIGYDFFQGPIVESAGDTAFALGRNIPGYKNLEMSSFVKYINGDPVYTDPNDAVEAYNYMSGFLRDGAPFINSETGVASKFVHPDDPNDNTGAGDGVWVDSDDHASGDRRFLMNAGPFTLASGDTQEVVFGMLIARGSDALSSITALKQVDQLAQLAYDIQFALPASPTAPNVVVSTEEDGIVLTWDDGVNAGESYSAVDVIDKLPIPESFDTTYTTGWFLSDAGLAGVTVLDSVTDYDVATSEWYTLYELQYIDVIDTTYIGQNTTFTFQGYNVYQLETASGQGAVKRIATYDLNDGITEIFDDVFDPVLGETINRRVQFGNDSGIKRTIYIDNDGLNAGIPLKTNRAYYFGVTSYGYNPYGIPKTLESPTNILTIRPQSSTTSGEAMSSADGSSSIAATHSSGASDGSVKIVVTDPSSVTGDDYSVSFRLNDDETTLVWDVKNTSDGTTLISGNPIQGGVDMETTQTVGENANPIVEGLQVMVSGPPNEFKDFYVTQNAGGPIDGYAGASADYNGYPGMGRDNIGSQQTNGSTWFFTTSNNSNKNYEDFYGYITRYTAGYSNPNGGIVHLIPDDFEFRFTATGGKMWDDANGVFIDVPMEVWNVGVVADPADDFQLMPMYWDPDGDGEWNLAAGDHAISGGSNDPFLESFYVLEHYLQEPGTTGYQAIIDALTADPTSNGAMTGYIWASSPNYLGVPGQITSVVMLNLTFANWNGGSVDDATFPANVDAVMPEEGTVFRVVTTKPNTASDVFTVSTSAYKTATTAYDPKKINVWPNPYFATNPEERTPLERRVTFTHLPETGTATIRVFNLSGQLVRKLLHNDGTQFEVWDLNNNFNIPVASGMYIAHVTTAAGDHVLKIGVVQPEERIDVY